MNYCALLSVLVGLLSACLQIYWFSGTSKPYCLFIDSAPARSLLFFVGDSVCMSVCLYVCNAPSNRFFFFVSRWNRAIFWHVISPCGTPPNVVLRILICCHGNEIWAIFAKISNCFFFFVFRWNRAIFWSLVLRDPLYKSLFFDFWFRPPNPKIYSPKFGTKSPISPLVWR